MLLGRALILSCGLASSVSADSLADMRQDLAGLLVDTRRLQLDIVTIQGGGSINDGSLLDKAVVIENELRRLT
ncbi:MAG TPA: tol-pal system protein, partial [Rhodobacteraceae bacterium]|nr:tol-pal system protein [Paracoccaceae bacterium]